MKKACDVIKIPPRTNAVGVKSLIMRVFSTTIIMFPENNVEMFTRRESLILLISNHHLPKLRYKLTLP